MDKIIYIPNYITNDKDIFNILLRQVSWQKINYFKRHVSHYTGNINEINCIIVDIETSFARKVTGIFFNYYENGNEYAPYHSDKYNCDTCLISFGEMRTLRYKENNINKNTDYNLNSGDLLFIPDEINNNYKHSLLKRTKLNNPRISMLVFLE